MIRTVTTDQTSTTNTVVSSARQWMRHGAICVCLLTLVGCESDAPATPSSADETTHCPASTPQEVVEQQLPASWDVVASHVSETTEHNQRVTAVLIEYRDPQTPPDAKPQRVRYLVQDGKVLGFHRVSPHATLPTSE
jgi:hypothetical protein